MTIVPAHRLVPAEIQHLGSSLAAEIRDDADELAAINRSLATLGEELDDIVAEAITSEHVAG